MATPFRSSGVLKMLLVTRHTSHVTRHTSHVTRHTSHVTRHTSHVTRHTSHVTGVPRPSTPPSSCPPATPLSWLPSAAGVACHVSRVTCHVSRVTCHVSRVTRDLLVTLPLQCARCRPKQMQNERQQAAAAASNHKELQRGGAAAGTQRYP